MIGDLSAYWAQRALSLAEYFSVIPHVMSGDKNTFAFMLGKFEHFRIAERDAYYLFTYSDYEEGVFTLKNLPDRTSKSIFDAIQRFCPTAVENLEFNKHAIKVLRVIS
jgi:hypothetical protein